MTQWLRSMPGETLSSNIPLLNIPSNTPLRVRHMLNMVVIQDISLSHLHNKAMHLSSTPRLLRIPTDMVMATQYLKVLQQAIYPHLIHMARPIILHNNNLIATVA